MRSFFHISEFNAEGFRLLPTLLMMNEHITLWAPSSVQLQTYNENQETFLQPKDILTLIESGKLSIIGRSDWLTDKAFRKHHRWEFSAWDENFDEVVREWAIVDNTKAIEKRRVIIADSENGFSFADEFIENHENSQKLEVLENRLKHKNFPAGTLEKLKRAKPEERIRIVLRDLYNHHEAKENSVAQQSIEVFNWIDLYTDILGLPEKTSYKNYELDSSKFWETLEFLRKIDSAKDFSELNSRLKRIEDGGLKKEIIEISRSNESISQVIEKSILENIKPPEWSQIFRLNLWDGISLSAIVSSLLDFGASPLSWYGLLAGIATSTLAPNTIGRNILEKHSILKTNNIGDYKLPYIVAYGRDTATYKEMDELRRKIIE